MLVLKNNFKSLIAVLAGALTLGVAAHAGTINGSAWGGATAFPDNLSTTAPSGPATATFTISNTSSNIFDFYSPDDADLTKFLTNNGTNGNVVNYLTGGDQNNVNEGCTVGAGNSCGINNDVMEFTGSTYMVNGATYGVTKDDAAYLVINGVSVLQSDSVSDTAADLDSFIWTGATGTYNFDLLYQEVNGAPAELESNITTVTPEPESILLLGTGLLAVAGLIRKRAGA